MVWKSFQEARPSSALAVSLPSDGMMGAPEVEDLATSRADACV